MATQFVKDLTQRRYEKLLKDYSYDERMKETIKQKDFQKQLDSYNDSLGKADGGRNAIWTKLSRALQSL